MRCVTSNTGSVRRFETEMFWCDIRPGQFFEFFFGGVSHVSRIVGRVSLVGQRKQGDVWLVPKREYPTSTAYLTCERMPAQCNSRASIWKLPSCSLTRSLRLDEPGDFEACGACVTYCSPPTRLQIFLAMSGGGELLLMQICWLFL